MRNADLRIGGIDCDACVKQLNKLSGSFGITEFTVNPVNYHAKIQYDENITSSNKIVSRIKRLGYSVSAMTAKIGLSSSLSEELMNQFKNMDGVKSVSFQENSLEMVITYWNLELTSDDFLHLLRDNGMEAKLLDVSGSDEEEILSERIAMLRRMAFSVLLTMPLMWNPAPIIQFVLGTIIQFGPNMYFYRGTLKSIRNKSPNMDSLIAISTTSIYLYSTVNALTQTEAIQLYFLGQGVLGSIIFFGKYMEILVKGEASQTIRELLRLQPQTATVIHKGEKITVDISDIEEGDCIWLREGERIPVDGTIEEGECVVNESMMTGESLPIKKEIGDEVYGGTYNCAGTAVYRAHHLGAESQLQQIIDIVEKAQFTKSPLQSATDRAATWFIPSVLIIAAITFLFWYFKLTDHNLGRSLMIMCGVLVIACPCALGLAAPTGMMVGSAKAAERGILFRGSAQIEKARDITDIVFDKTGTLTFGNMVVENVVSLGSMEEDEILSYAAFLEQHSIHPIAKAITDSAEDIMSTIRLECQEVQSFGNGMYGVINGKTALCGNKNFLEERDVKIPNLQEILGTTAVYLAIDSEVEGIIYLSDEVRPEAGETVNSLKNFGMTVWMLTGDRESAAKSVADNLGIENIISEVTPEEKIEFIMELQEQGRKVSMVGDGINDAPALTKSDLSIAIGSGTAAAVEASDVVLLGKELSAVCDTFIISKQILRVIRENFLWAIFYNIISIPLACAGIVNPSIASAAMSFSSIFVLLHSLKLKKLLSEEKI